MWPAAAVDAAGPRKPEHQSLTFTFFAFLRGIAAIIGPILSGVLLEAGKAAMNSDSRYGKFGFGGVEIFVGSCAFATSIGSLAMVTFKNRAQ